MVNRNIQQKILKMKRRGRKARFSGATSKYAVRLDQGVLDKQGKVLEIPVGPISFSTQVMSTGRGPNQERMAEYYNRLRSFADKVPPTKPDVLLKSEVFGEWFESYQRILDEAKEMRICLLDNHLGRVDLFFKSGGNEWFFVDIDYKEKTFKRSRLYSSKTVAIDRWKNRRVTWVEYISPQ